MRRFGVALLVLAAGCSLPQAPAGSSTPSSGPAVSLLLTPVPSPDLDPAWTLHADDGEGYAIAFPDTWNFVFRDSRTFDADVKALNNADLIKFFGDGFKNGQAGGLKLIAAEPRSIQSGFVTSLSVFKTDLGPSDTAPGLAGIAASKQNLFTRTDGLVGEVKRQQVKVPAGTLEQLQYSIKPSDRVATISSYLGTLEAGGHRFLYEVLVGTNVQDPAGLFDRVIKTFRILGVGSAGASPTPVPSPRATPSTAAASPGATAPGRASSSPR
jgi:hypothetical protein